MLRQSYMNKYKEKSKYDDERFLKEDEGYLLKESRPITGKAIRSLNKNKMYQFIEDVLTNRKMTSVLYPSNAKIEIKTYIKTKKNFIRKSDELEKKRKERNEPSSVVKKRSRKEAYYQMRKEIDSFKDSKEKIKRLLTCNTVKKSKNFKKDLEKQKDEYFDSMRKNYINGFRRAYSRLKFKLDILKVPTNEEYIETEVDYPYLAEFTTPRIHFAEPKLRIKDAYNRLYNNAIILPKDDIKVSIKKRPSSAVNKKKPIAKNQNVKKKLVLNLKNALISNEGKEFIIRITDKLYKKCYDKYSGGPTTIKNLQNPKEYLEAPSRDSYYINYYSLIEPKTGNTFLHLATIDDYPELVKYFIEKGADLNMKNSDGNTPLHLAIKAKRNKIIKLLIDNKAALDITNNDGEIPFECLTPDMKKEFGVDTIIILNPAKRNNI